MKRFSCFLFSVFLLTINSTLFAAEKIAYSHLTDGYWQIWVMNPDGSNKKQVTTSKEDKRTPSFLSDGQSVGYRTSNGKLFVTNLVTGQVQSILDQYSIINNPHFSKTKEEVAFVRYDPTALDIAHVWLSDFKGEKSRILTQDTVFSSQPKISNSGDKIVFVRHGDTKRVQYVWIMDIDGQNKEQLTDGITMDSSPDFSADGSSITFSSSREGEDYEIYRIDLKTKKIDQLTNDTFSEHSPVYSLDSQFIAFVSDKSGTRQIWKMNLQTKEEVQLTTDTESIDPVWGNLKEEGKK